MANYCDFYVGDLETPCSLNGRFGFDEIIIVNSDYIASFDMAATIGGSSSDSVENPGNIITSVNPIPIPAWGPVFSTIITDPRVTRFTGSAKSLAGGAMYRTTQKTLQFVVKNSTAHIAAEITKLKNGKFVVFARRPSPYEGGFAHPDVTPLYSNVLNYIEVFGSENPMVVSACEQVLSGDDVDAAYYGGWLITMQCTELSDSVFYFNKDANPSQSTSVMTSWNTLASMNFAPES